MSAITFSGMNGIDFNMILDAVMQAESQPLRALQNDQAKIQNKDSAFLSLSGIINALKTPVNALTGSAAFTGVAATSSNTSVATVSASGGATPGQYSVSVSQLARAQVTKSENGYSAATDVAATGGSISFTINGETTEAISVTTDTTLADLAQQINDQGSGVIASVINDGTNNKLVIMSRETGAANGFTINNTLTNSKGAAVAFTAGQSPTFGNAQDARNARLNVNGIDIQSASNSVTGAIAGISLTLTGEGNAQIGASRDFSGAKENLKALVASYNKIRQFYSDQAKGVLGTDPLMREVVNDLKTVLLTSNANGGRYKYLSEIGLELTSTGELKLDESKFDAAIKSYSADVQKLFQGAGSADGAFDNLIKTLENLDGDTGLIKTARNSIATTLSGYANRIEHQQAMLEIRRQALQKMYAAADQAISQLNQMTSALSNLNK